LALHAIKRHEGVMRVESSEGRGTTVMIWLPAGSATKLEKAALKAT
jgi:signal transduction histidine kinase